MADITLMDGGLGQEVYRRSGSPAHPLWSVQVMQEAPETVQGVHEDFVRAGAHILTLNTYAATPSRLSRDGDPSQFEFLQKKAFEIALESGKPVLLGFTLDDEQHLQLRSGESVQNMVEQVKDLPLRGLLFNCSRPETINEALGYLGEAGFYFGAYANGFESADDLQPD